MAVGLESSRRGFLSCLVMGYRIDLPTRVVQRGDSIVLGHLHLQGRKLPALSADLAAQETQTCLRAL